MTRYHHGPKPVLGLVGAIGAGKSVAAEMLAEWGGTIIDADSLGHLALEQQNVKDHLVERWGDRILKPDGAINRRVVASIVFKDLTELKALEATVYPVIATQARAVLNTSQLDSDTKMVVLDAAMLYEAGWAELCDKVLFLDAARETRLTRVAKRSGWAEADLAAREAAQWPLDRKRALADAVVVNDGSMDQLRSELLMQLTLWGFELNETPMRERNG